MVSIIIPFQKDSAYLRQTIFGIAALAYKNIELILLPDSDLDIKYAIADIGSLCFEIKIQKTGAVSPAVKRDIGAQISAGSILAFIDDDAYPDKNWLDSLIVHFKDEAVCAVGGPQVTPTEDTFWQKVSGASFLSILNGKASHRYYSAKKSYYVEDWPSVNLLVRKKDFDEVGGFDNNFWPGEDTKLCYDLIKNNKKIVYEPTGIVYHHRRAGFVRHMRQVGNYGLYRGYFARKYPETSLKLSYLLPSMFFLFVAFGWIIWFSPLYMLYCFLWLLYLSAIAISFASIYLKTKNLLISVSTIPYTVGTHFVYGYRFLKGFFSKNIKESLGR